ncbi:thioredoxin Y1, chloroplastic-like isoform X2 [Olea europaea var. sylvestris]|uniref:thioredoxin Y1, chloroplastic-like isoform X2 n=1 Tax=Olea europaea var. sylvestris TaxID=158386 RepID=UPI000C1D534F|nr:thioredoxin Y1, chloroplastic-like isoform X2 [Olea europaea var. sylvestris]
MAISVATAVVPGNVAVSSSSSVHSQIKFCHLSSLQFPNELRALTIRNRRLLSKLGPRTLPLVEAKKQTFSSFDDLLENADKPVLVDFYATWCGPCQFMVPILEQVSDSMSDKIQIVKIDTEKYPIIAEKYKIQALPTFILFKDGKPCDRFAGHHQLS